MDGSFEFVAVKIAGELVSVLLQLQQKRERRSVEVGSHDPSPGDRGIRAADLGLSVVGLSGLRAKTPGTRSNINRALSIYFS